MLIAVDAGNTHTVVGLFEGDELTDHWRMATNAARTSDEHALLMAQFLAQHGSDFDDVTGMVVSSTVPRYGGPTIMVDFGTATTVDAISAKGEYLGGAILPGIEISLDALFARAAALSWVELAKPRRVIGKSTAESVQAGVLYGFASAVDGLVTRFQAELGPCTVVSTGGLAELIGPLASTIQHHDLWLTLRGLRLIHAMNVS